MTMKGVINAAKAANGRSRSCEKCSVKETSKVCNPQFMRVCYRAFEEGFVKGATYFKEHLWHCASSQSPKKNRPLLLLLSDNMVVLGNFEGWGYSFGVPEAKLKEKVEVTAWMYLKDIM